MTLSSRELLKTILSQPTAPFREHFVLSAIESICEQKKLPYCFDASKNLIVGVKKLSDLSRGRRLLLLAHTDHPGFHVLSQSGKTLSAKWYGGAPFSQMIGCKVRVYDSSLPHLSHEAKVTHIEKGPYKRTGMRMTMELKTETQISKGSFGAFDFPACKFSGDRLIARVADDLVGVVIALGAVLDTRKAKGKCVAVLTRAEEVGFVGCLNFLKSTPLSKETIAISLEASRTLPGALLGKGPVLRLGDKSTLFDNEASTYLLKTAENIKKIKFQRRIMDGGSCEASALNRYKVRTTGLAVPLENYHNQGVRKPMPEIVRVSDIESARSICAEAVRNLSRFEAITTDFTRSIEKNYLVLKRLLGTKSASFLET